MDFNIFDSTLLILLVAVAISSLLHKLRLPAIFAYLFVGIMVGPHGFAWIPDSQDTRHLAEFGIVFLMFTIGLEFSLPRLLSMKRVVFGYGGIQVCLSILVTVVIGRSLGMSLSEAMVVGSIISMSSTAIVIKQLTDQVEASTAHGINAIGILLFQDLAVIPLLILIPSLVGVDSFSLLIDMSKALFRGVAAIFIILSFGRWVLKPMYYHITASRSVELFTLTTLLVTLGCAWVTHALGLSMALGAFVAGMMLSETEFRHQIEVDIRPFRDVLLGLFFISVGMQLNLGVVIYNWPWMMLLLAALVLFKTTLVTAISVAYGDDLPQAMRTGIILAQGGEFGFALLTLAFRYQLLPEAYAQVILGAIILSMAVGTVAIRLNGVLVRFLLPGQENATGATSIEHVSQLSHPLNQHVVICGYGRVGQNIARILEQEHIQSISFDLDPHLVKQATQAGENVCYADATHFDILEAAGIARARAIVICFYGLSSALKIVQQVRAHYPDLPIVVRSHDNSEADTLLAYGASDVIPEALEASLVLASHLLLKLGVSRERVHERIAQTRSQHYEILRRVYQGDDILSYESDEPLPEGLHSIVLTENAYAVHKTIAALQLDELDVKIVSVKRNKEKIHAPSEQLTLLADDVVVLYGPTESFAAASKRILIG